MAGHKPRELHDVLVFPPSDKGKRPEWYRFEVNRTGTPAQVGKFLTAPTEERRLGDGTRRSESIARPDEVKSGGEVFPPRGPALATLPIKPEPGGASGVTCYLLNADNFHAPNFWTVEEWNDGPGGETYQAPVHPNNFEVLLAGPLGKVFQVTIRDVAKWKVGSSQKTTAGAATKGDTSADDGEAFIACVDLRHNTEIWTQLRSGCVAGRVLYNSQKERVVPLVNVTALGGEEFACHHVEDPPSSSDKAEGFQS